MTETPALNAAGAGVGRYLTLCNIGETLHLLKLFEEGNFLRKCCLFQACYIQISK